MKIAVVGSTVVLFVAVVTVGVPPEPAGPIAAVPALFASFESL